MMLLSLLSAPWLAPGPSSARLASPAAMQLQGGSLRTWHSPDPWAEEGGFFLGTEGRPMDANVELWSGPDNTAFRMRVYGENGNLRPVRGTVGMRGRHPRSNAIAVRNAGPLEFPMSDVGVFGGGAEQPSIECLESASTVQGGSLRTYPVGPYVDAVQVLLRSDGLPVNATIEIVQGPNTNRQGIELYTDDGRERPIFYILETPGYGRCLSRCLCRHRRSQPAPRPPYACPSPLRQRGRGAQHWPAGVPDRRLGRAALGRHG